MKLAAFFGFNQCRLIAGHLGGGGPCGRASRVLPMLWRGFLAAADFRPVQGAALNLAHMQGGRNIAVLMPYADRFERLAFWYRQLWAESLGKAGQGSVPVNALGPVDQHSQVQLYMDGPDDKLYTVLTFETRGPDPVCRLPLPMMRRLRPWLIIAWAIWSMPRRAARWMFWLMRGVPCDTCNVDGINDESLGTIDAFSIGDDLYR